MPEPLEYTFVEVSGASTPLPTIPLKYEALLLKPPLTNVYSPNTLLKVPPVVFLTRYNNSVISVSLSVTTYSLISLVSI